MSEYKTDKLSGLLKRMKNNSMGEKRKPTTYLVILTKFFNRKEF